MNSLVFSFSEAYRKEGFLQWLQKEADAVRYLDFHALEGCCCYCDENAQEAIEKAEREFEIYREREMRLLESDFDKAVKRLKNKKDKDDKEET